MATSGSALHAVVPQPRDGALHPVVPRPSDEEQAEMLRLRTIAGEASPDSLVIERDVYGVPPWEILGEQKEAFCFSPATYHESAHGGPTGRRKREMVVGGGDGDAGEVWCWHQDKGKVAILDPDGNSVLGHKSTYGLVSKDQPGAATPPSRRYERLGYSMTEIELNDDAGTSKLVLCKVYKSPRTNPGTGLSGLCLAPVSARLKPRRFIRPTPCRVRSVREIVGSLDNANALAVSEVQRSRGAAAAPVVMKFGRPLVESAERMQEMAKVILDFNARHSIVVLSDMGKTISNLLQNQAGEEALSCGSLMAPVIDEVKLIKESHLRTTIALGLDPSILSDTFSEMEQLLAVKELSPKTQAYLVSFGERLSTTIFCAYLDKLGIMARQYDALDVGLMTIDKYIERIERDWNDNQAIPIVAGSLGKEWESGAITTLGRGGSDLTAILTGKALRAREIQVWKDAPGVLTCDPNICANAIQLSNLTFDEATEIGLFSAQSMQLAMKGGIPVIVKNFLNPQALGTMISETRHMSKSVLTCIVSRSNITMLKIESATMCKQSVFAARSFSAFANLGISFDCVAISEGKISMIVVPSNPSSHELVQPELDNVVEELEKFAVVNRLRDRSVISLIGNNRRMSPIILVKAVNVLRSINVDVQEFSQGSSEVMKVSLVVDNNEIEYCVRALHSVFFEKGVVSEIQGAAVQVPENSPAAAASSGDKRKAVGDHQEAPPGVRQERMDTDPDDRPEETKHQLSPGNDPMAVGRDNIGHPDELFDGITGIEVEPIRGDDGRNSDPFFSGTELNADEYPQEHTRAGDGGGGAQGQFNFYEFRQMRVEDSCPKIPAEFGVQCTSEVETVEQQGIAELAEASMAPRHVLEESTKMNRIALRPSKLRSRDDINDGRDLAKDVFEQQGLADVPEGGSGFRTLDEIREFLLPEGDNGGDQAATLEGDRNLDDAGVLPIGGGEQAMPRSATGAVTEGDAGQGFRTDDISSQLPPSGDEFFPLSEWGNEVYALCSSESPPSLEDYMVDLTSFKDFDPLLWSMD